MPYARPTLTALRTQAIEDITTSGVPNLDGLLRNAVLRVLAWVMAGLAYSEYGYLDWIARQSVPFTATDEYLEAWAALKDVYRKDPTAGSGFAIYTGTIGTVLPIDTPLTRQDGTPYTTTAEGTVDGTGTVTVPILAAVYGSATNCDDGTPISINTPLVGINAGGLTSGPVTGGSDLEGQDSLQTRMLAVYAAPPQGGSAADYVKWALEVPGVTRAWCSPNEMGAGSVTVRFMLDDVESAHGGFPQGTDGTASEETRGLAIATGDQLAVAEHIWPVQPVTALVYAVAPVGTPINVTLAGLSPATVEIEALIVAAIEDMLIGRAEVGGVIFPSDLYQAISSTPGVVHFTMTSPTLPIELLPGELPIMGTLTVT